MKTKEQAISLLRAWFDDQGGAVYVHHDSETETTVDGQIDVAGMALQLLDLLQQERTAERERCAILCEETGAFEEESDMAVRCAKAIRRA